MNLEEYKAMVGRLNKIIGADGAMMRAMKDTTGGELEQMIEQLNKKVDEAMTRAKEGG